MPVIVIQIILAIFGISVLWICASLTKDIAEDEIIIREGYVKRDM